MVVRDCDPLGGRKWAWWWWSRPGLPQPLIFSSLSLAGQRHSPLSQRHSPGSQCPSPSPPARATAPCPSCQSPGPQRRSPAPPCPSPQQRRSPVPPPCQSPSPQRRSPGPPPPGPAPQPRPPPPPPPGERPYAKPPSHHVKAGFQGRRSYSELAEGAGYAGTAPAWLQAEAATLPKPRAYGGELYGPGRPLSPRRAFDGLRLRFEKQPSEEDEWAVPASPPSPELGTIRCASFCAGFPIPESPAATAYAHADHAQSWPSINVSGDTHPKLRADRLAPLLLLLPPAWLCHPPWAPPLGSFLPRPHATTTPPGRSVILIADKHVVTSNKIHLGSWLHQEKVALWPSLMPTLNPRIFTYV